MSDLDHMTLESALDFDKPLSPDERLSRALGVMGLMGWQIRRALDEGALCEGRRDDLIDMVIRELERARRAVRKEAA